MPAETPPDDEPGPTTETSDDLATDLCHWPDPHPSDVEVLLLGTYHMDNPGLDVVTVDADDVLAPERQVELQDLADRLAGWDPDAVAVERPFARQGDVDDLYADYRAGDRAYDAVSEVDPPHPMRDDPTTECRSEVVQVGFRLADRCDHDRVHAVDDPASMAANLDDDEAERVDLGALTARAVETLDAPLPDPEATQRAADEHLAAATVPEHLRWTNREARLHRNHDLMFAAAMAGTDERYLGSQLLAGWYERNLRMVENVWRAVGDGDERAVFVVGSGHVHVLRHLLGEVPGLCPASPLPVLS